MAELEAYAPLVTSESYIVATDGLMEFLDDVPRGKPSWRTDNPKAAAADFAKRHPESQPSVGPWEGPHRIGSRMAFTVAMAFCGKHN